MKSEIGVGNFRVGLAEVGICGAECQKRITRGNRCFRSKIDLPDKIKGKGGTAVFLVEIQKGQKITLETQEGIAKYRWVKISNLEQFVKKGQLSDWFSLWSYALAKSKQLV